MTALRAEAAALAEMLPAAAPPEPLPPLPEVAVPVMDAKALVVAVRALLSMPALAPVLRQARAAEAEDSRVAATLAEAAAVAEEALSAVPPAPICMSEV